MALQPPLLESVPSSQNLSSSTDGVPLHCTICTRKPHFSDVSHLLTHIGSKGHLSSYYKIKVRSATEEPARQLINDYDA